MSGNAVIVGAFLFIIRISVESLPSFKDYSGQNGNSVGKYSSSNAGAPVIQQKNSCYADIDGKVLNLKPLERSDGSPRFYTEVQNLTFSFNPCSPFNLPEVPHGVPNSYGDDCVQVAFCINKTESVSHYYYTYGVHTDVSFNGEFSPLSNSLKIELVYKGIKSMRNKKTHIKLICDRSRSAADDGLFVINYHKQKDLSVELHHLCCCLDGCLPPGEQKTNKSMLIVLVGVHLGLLLLAGLIGVLCYLKRTHLQIYFKLPGLHAISSRGFTHFGSMENGLKKSSAYRDYEPAVQLKKSTPLAILDDCFIPDDDLECGQRLGGGLFADTYIGQWKDTTVAIKRLTVNTHGNQMLPSTVNAMTDIVNVLSRQRHKNIVGIIGMSTDSKHPYVISEFVDGECLKDFSRSRGVQVDWPQRVHICLQMADGMAFLHSMKPPILHRDLRCANVFISTWDVVKVADFGLVKLLQPIRDRCDRDDCCCRREMSGCPATLKWTAPEVLSRPHTKEGEKEITTACDVYSFGMVLWELIMCEDPFDEITSEEEVMELVINGVRPEFPSSRDMFQLYEDLTNTCWVHDPHKRPTFKQIAVKFKDMFRHARTFQKVINNHKKRQNSPS